MVKKLYRNRHDKMIGGVASGLADYFEVDPLIIRALFIIITIAYGIGGVAYIVLWIIVPANDFDNIENFGTYDTTSNFDTKIETDEFDNINYTNKKNDRKLLGGIVLIVIGFLLFLNQILPDFEFEYIVPIILIIIGVSILYKQNYFRKRGE